MLLKKNHSKKTIKINIAVIIIMILFLILSGCTQKTDNPPNQDKSPKDIELLGIMFPENNFTQESKGYRDDEGKLYIIKDIIQDSFVVEKDLENLVIVEITEGLSHAEGFYQAYLAVFDDSGRNFISSIKNFSADEGKIALFKGKARTYIFFAGNSTFNGWTGWAGGLWEAGREWSLKWPEENDFWEHQAVEIEENSLKIFTRKITNSTDQLVPDYEWEYAYSLEWDADASFFTKPTD